MIAGMLGRQFPPVEAMLRDAAVDVTAFAGFPLSHLARQPAGAAEQGDQAVHRRGRVTGPGPLPGADHAISDQYVQGRQEGVQVVRHSRSWMPSAHFMINPTRRVSPNWESLI